MKLVTMQNACARFSDLLSINVGLLESLQNSPPNNAIEYIESIICEMQVRTDRHRSFGDPFRGSFAVRVKRSGATQANVLDELLENALKTG